LSLFSSSPQVACTTVWLCLMRHSAPVCHFPSEKASLIGSGPDLLGEDFFPQGRLSARLRGLLCACHLFLLAIFFQGQHYFTFPFRADATPTANTVFIFSALGMPQPVFLLDPHRCLPFRPPRERAELFCVVPNVLFLSPRRNSFPLKPPQHRFFLQSLDRNSFVGVVNFSLS